MNNEVQKVIDDAIKVLEKPNVLFGRGQYIRVDGIVWDETKSLPDITEKQCQVCVWGALFLAGAKVDSLYRYMKKTLWANNVVLCTINDKQCSNKNDQINLLNDVRKYFQ